ncbi:MAG: rhomboid family intramembrane serine protease [Chthoniobacterales bacterium]|nr:rhomboid family intramembrane serine protease [Chthoniobacterales bacterium]
MKWDFLVVAERKLSHLAIARSVQYLALLNGLVFLLCVAIPEYRGYLSFRPELVWQGEVWRIFSWVFLPREDSAIWVLFAILFLWFLGDILEAAWGALRVNFYLLAGWFFNTMAGLFLPDGDLAAAANLIFQLSILFGACVAAPNYEILLFFVLPIRLKWIGILSAVLPIMLLLSLPWAGRVALVAAFGNFLLFWIYESLSKGQGLRNFVKHLKEQRNGNQNEETIHCCFVCKRTEKTNPELEFRVSSDGNEYCMEHLPKKDR